MNEQNKITIIASNYRGCLVDVDLVNHKYLIHGKEATTIDQLDEIINHECKIIQDSIVDENNWHEHVENF